MKESVEQLILTAKIGDGHFIKQAINASVTYSSVLEDYMTYKRKILVDNNYRCSDVKLKDNSLGFNTKGEIYTLTTHVDERITELYGMSRIEVLNNLDYFGLLMYYLDDGSYHITRHSMHIYCNSFTDEEVGCLKKAIYRLFPYKECRNRVDRKKDGRQYPYLYIPVVTVVEIIKFYRDFIMNEPLLHCMAYKLGLPSQTIEKQ